MSSDGRGASNFLENPISQPKRAAFSRFSDQAVPIRTIFGVNLLPVSAEEGFNEIHPLDLGKRSLFPLRCAEKATHDAMISIISFDVKFLSVFLM